MTRTVRPYADGDLAGFEPVPGQARDFTAAWKVADAARLLVKGGRAFTLRDHDGTVLLVAGVAKVDEGYGHAWAFMSVHSAGKMRWLTAKVRGYLDTLLTEQRRIELMARADYPAAAKWAARLGFELEGTRRCAALDGGDLLQFARINRAWRPAWEMAA